jgi:cytoskeletal protein RodZ
MESLGQFLRKERELRDISLKEIAHQTKISPFYLRALETDNFSVFPGEVFVRGFLQNYATCIGLDANDIVNRYLDQIRLPEEVSLPTLAELQDAQEKKSVPTSTPAIPTAGIKVGKWAVVIGALIALGILIQYTVSIWNR